MRRVAIDDPAIVGLPVGRDVTTADGHVLLRAGSVPGARTRSTLLARGVRWCFVRDGIGEALDLDAVLPANVAGSLRSELGELTEQLARAAGLLQRHSTLRVLREIRNGKMPLPARAIEIVASLREAANEIASLAPRMDARGGYLPDRHGGDELAGHPVQVAAIAARIGWLAGFNSADIAATAYAALLHDIGLIFVPPEVRALPPARRSPAERRRYEDHVLLGEALLRRMVDESHVWLVALDHHERQDGRGYPHRHSGRNRLLRNAEDLHDPTCLSLVSEIVTVADRYERLLSGDVGDVGLTPSAARRIIEAEAGSVLNAEVVTRFLDSFPVRPVGTSVTLSGGSLSGVHAVVLEDNPVDPSRPRVLAVSDARGQAMRPHEVDLAHEQGMAAVEPEASAAAAVR